MEILTVQRGYTEKTKQFFSNGFNTWERVFAQKSETCFCSLENTLMFVTVWSIYLAPVQNKHLLSRVSTIWPAVCILSPDQRPLSCNDDIKNRTNKISYHLQRKVFDPPFYLLPIFVEVCPSSELSEMRPKLNKYIQNSKFPSEFGRIFIVKLTGKSLNIRVNCN